MSGNPTQIQICFDEVIVQNKTLSTDRSDHRCKILKVHILCTTNVYIYSYANDRWQILSSMAVELFCNVKINDMVNIS